MLSYVYDGTSYKIPALFAGMRFISLEYNTARSNKAAAIIADVLKPAAKDAKTGNTHINLDFGAPKDEGDFDTVDLMLPMLGVSKDDKDKNKSEEERFIGSLETVIGLVAADKELASTYIGKNYVPFIIDLEKWSHSVA